MLCNDSGIDKVTAMSVMIIGAGGFIGRHLAKRYIETETDLYLGVRAGNSSGLLSELVQLYPKANVTAVEIDIADPVDLKKKIETIRPETLIFAAALASQVQMATADTCFSEARALWDVSNACSSSGVSRLIFLSSPAVYAGNKSPISEKMCMQPVTEYGLGKQLGSVVSAYCRRSLGLEIIECRLFNVYGPGDKDARLIPQLVKSVQSGKSIRLLSPNNECDFIYITDVAVSYTHLTLPTKRIV